MTTDISTESWVRLRAHLHRGGAWTYAWTLEDKTSHWVPSDKPLPIPDGKVNAYFGVHPTDKPRGRNQRARLQDVCAVNCLFADLDAKMFDGDKARALAQVEQFIEYAPSVIVDSGGGYHCYWLLADPFLLRDAADRQRVAKTQARWVALIGGDPGAKDLARVLRIPGTVNYKAEHAPNFPVVVIVKADFDRVYSLDTLEPIAQTAPAGQGLTAETLRTSSGGNGHNRYVEAALAGELDKLARATEGARNTQLNASAFALGQFVGADALDRGEVETQLGNVAQMIGLSERETRATIRSGLDAGMKEPRAIPDNGHESRGDAIADAEESVPSIAEQAGQYLVRDGRICRRKKTQDGAVIVPLCNFKARITEEVTRDDGADVTRLLTIEGSHMEGGAFLPAKVDAMQFGSMRWVPPSWGAHAIVEAGTAAQDHLRAAIQYLSPQIKTRHVFAHTGWRETNGKRVFLSQAGAVGDAGVIVELEKEIERYTLPTYPQAPQAAMQTSLQFLEIAPKRVTVPLWAGMFVAPLAEIIPLRFMLWLYGGTGVFKSALVAVALSHYGDYSQDDLVQWDNTSNSLGKYLFHAKDVPFVIDDFAPQTDPVGARRLEQVANSIVRHVGNRSGRGRLKGDLTQRTIYRPRGLVISTGEQLPNGQSLVGRLVTVDFRKGDVDVARLTRAQDDQAVYPDAMAAYILWLANQWDALVETLPAQWRQLRATARKENQHARLPESVASLYVGFDLGLSFAVEIGALDAAQAQTMRDEGWTALCGIAECQHTFTEEQRPTRRYLIVIKELWEQGKARLNHTDTPESNGDGEMLGWYDANYLYLLPSASYHCVAKYERDEGRVFGVKENALRKMLAEEGISVASDDTHLAARLLVNGQNKRVLKLSVPEVEKILGVPLQKVGKVG